MTVGRKTVLVDTNVILEAHRTASWNALTGRFRVETVEECIKETQTGFQNRRPEQTIYSPTLRQSLKAIHTVGEVELAALVVAEPDADQLDPGELALWQHTYGRKDIWVLCGPDEASLRVGFRLGFSDNLVTLEELLAEAGFRCRIALRRNYTLAWTRLKLGQLALNGGNYLG